MEALVTGATGFIGSYVARALVDEGWSVRCLARPTSSKVALEDVDVRWVEGDVRDVASLRAAARGCDALFHVAAYYALWSDDPAQFQAINVEGTRNVLQAAREEGVRRVVHTSSVATVGDPPPGELGTEATMARPDSGWAEYKRTKFEAEQVALQAAADGQDVVVVNPGAVIGPGDRKPTPTGKIIVDFLEGKLPFYVDTGLNFVDVRDVARGHLLAFEKGEAGQRYILANRDNNKTLREFLQVLGAVSGKKPPRFKVPYGVAWMAGAVSTFVADHITHQTPGVPLEGVRMSKHRMYFDPSRAIAELDLPQTPLEQTVRDAVAWYRANTARA